MTVPVTVLRVFTDADGRFGNPLGVIDAAAVEPRDRQRIAAQLGFSETLFLDPPAAGASSAALRIFTPATELPFAGHPTVGAAWYLRQRATPVNTLMVPAGPVEVTYRDDVTAVRARAEWAPEFALHALAGETDVLVADPAQYPPGAAHYLWAWTDRAAGAVRCRMFAPDLGVAEDEATGAAAVRLTARLRRDLRITQGLGSSIETTWRDDGWIGVGGRVREDRTLALDVG